jgi:hypothetical protein
MFSEANGSRSTLAMEKKEGTLDSDEMEMTEKGTKKEVFFIFAGTLTNELRHTPMSYAPQ